MTAIPVSLIAIPVNPAVILATAIPVTAIPATATPVTATPATADPITAIARVHAMIAS